MPRCLSYARQGMFVLFLFGLSACSFMKPGPTLVQGTVASGQKLNLDSRNRATPVVIRVYVLKNAAAFSSADFFSLFEKEQQTLSDNLISREEILLKPGETRVIQSRNAEQGAYLGVVAAFRNIDKAAWRSGVTLTGGKTNDIRIELDNDFVKTNVSVK